MSLRVKTEILYRLDTDTVQITSEGITDYFTIYKNHFNHEENYSYDLFMKVTVSNSFY